MGLYLSSAAHLFVFRATLQCAVSLKIDRADVHFGYRGVRGSSRVYKAELDGEMRAAKVSTVLSWTTDHLELPAVIILRTLHEQDTSSIFCCIYAVLL